MRLLLVPTAAVVAALLTSCAPAAQSSAPPEQTTAPATASPTPSATPTPTPEPVAAIEVTAAGLSLVDASGAVVEEILVADGSDTMLQELTDLLGEPSSVAEDNECYADGTIITTWAAVGAKLRVSPPDDRSADPFDVGFRAKDGEAGPKSDIVVRIPDGPAVGEDAGSFFDTVPTAQQGGQGDGFGTMIYELDQDVPADAEFHDLRGAGGYLDESRILQILLTPASHSAFYC